jgi:transposase-like protein
MNRSDYDKENFTKELRELRFNKGKVCPKCNSNHVVKNGKFNDKQRYLCKDCRKTFNDFTATPLSDSKKDMSVWGKFINCMVNEFSLRKTASICGISLPTAFYWRHKVLDAIKQFDGRGDVEGIVEADETFFLESFKGNHKKSSFTMPRKPHKRGGQAKTSGISKEYVCVSTAIDRNENIILEMTNMGRITINDLKRLYDGHIETGSIICTDSHRSYPKFANQLNLTHIKLKGGKKKEDIYHLQNVNSFHSRLKGWTRKFNGVSTKHLSNYLGWFKYKELFKNEKEQIKMKNLLLHANLFYTETKIESVSNRLPNYI